MAIRTGQRLHIARTKCSPQLPRHDKSTTDDGRGTFCGENGNCDFLQAHANTEQRAAKILLVSFTQIFSELRPVLPARQKLSPCLRNSHANGHKQGEDCADKDGGTATKQVVQRIRHPAGTRVTAIVRDEFRTRRPLVKEGRNVRGNIQDEDGNIGHSIDDTLNPLVLSACTSIGIRPTRRAGGVGNA